MAYSTSRSSKVFLNKILNSGKESSLIPPHYKPPLQRIFEPISFLALILTIPAYYYLGIYHAIVSLSIFLILFGIIDLFIQDDHALIRIYGPLGRLRYIFEDVIRDKYLQYFNETNTDGRPIPRIVRDYIYQKAHNVKSISSFGTELDIYDPEITTQSRLLHRNFPGIAEQKTYGVLVGEKRKNVKPFLIKSTINISAMSYGSLNYKAAEALSIGAKDIAYVNTGEGGFGPHGVAGNDTVFQIGTGKFGVGKDAVMHNGKETRALDEALLIELVRSNPNIKMIQIKISQGAKPGLGGVLPADKVTPEIAAVRKVKPYKTIHSPPQHVELMGATPKESVNLLMEFIDKIRNITELPVGIKLCVGRMDELDLLVAAMKSTGKGPDAIQIDGADGGTGAGPNLFLNYVGYGSAIETLHYLDSLLKKEKIRDSVVLSPSGRIFTPAHAALAFAYGADTIDTARAAMLALGCIQAIKCHTNHCPTGITTNSPWRMHGLNVPEKATRVHHFIQGFNEDMMLLTKVLGHSDPRDIQKDDLRLITHKDNFAAHFEEDPFGLKVSKHY
ncbi:MAG: FMN-binding glutamate synthase family protein [Leptospiraceae bacterium]|nr:FMN-binding glutamate synthase family protein [Leptospiraceae bacterium]